MHLYRDAQKQKILVSPHLKSELSLTTTKRQFVVKVKDQTLELASNQYEKNHDLEFARMFKLLLAKCKLFD